mmetsp:Transcript_28231/g.38638  ORF Transcript_28231/g.38638 Transcript_28231/m.38638 type:complete len:92 (+) Transcript_28231:701-976(+)
MLSEVIAEIQKSQDNPECRSSFGRKARPPTSGFLEVCEALNPVAMRSSKICENMVPTTDGNHKTRAHSRKYSNRKLSHDVSVSEYGLGCIR